MNSIFSQSYYLIKEAWQSLRRRPGFVSSVVITMGMTTGALVCVSTLAYLLLVKPLPYEDQDRLYRVDHRLVSPTGEKSMPAFTYPGIMHLYNNQDVFSETALISYGNDVISSVPNQPVVNIGYITPEWFSLFSASFGLGRGFDDTEAVDTNNPVAILSYETWKREYGASPDVLNKTISLSGINFRVIGVVSEAFVEPQIHGVESATGVWIPWDYNFGKKWRTVWQKFTSSLTFVGKLHEDTSMSQAQQSVGSTVNDKWKANIVGIDFFKNHEVEIEFRSFRSLILGESKKPIFLLLAAALGLVAIAVVNISNLFMSRTVQQQQTLAIRAAVGASRIRVFTSLFAESGLLMVAAGFVSLLVATGGIRIIKNHLATVLPRVGELSVDMFSVGMAIFIAMTLAALFARLSLGIIDFRALNSSMQSSGKGNAVQVSSRARQFLISSQISIALALVFVNISLFQTAYKTITTPLGLELENITYLTLSYAGRSRPPLDEVAPIMTEVRRRLLQLPEVESLSQSYSPFDRGNFIRLLSRDKNNRLVAQPKGIDNQYFQLIGQPLLEGKYFSEDDIVSMENNRYRNVILNDMLAKTIAPEDSALGVIELPGFSKPVNVIGIVKGVRIPGQDEVTMRVFHPLNRGVTRLLIKLKDNQSLSRRQVGRILREISDSWSVWQFEILQENIQKKLFAQTTTAITTVILTILTCFLVGVGLYGVLSYSMQIRRFEIGIRMAVGAKGRDIVRLIVGENIIAILYGIFGCIVLLLGLVVWLGEHVMEYVIWQSALTFFVTLTIVSLVTVLTSYLPARDYINKPVVNSLRADH